MFEQRPIWTRLGLFDSLRPENRKIIKKLLPLVAYYFFNGPWRACWVRYGFDPRKTVTSRLYVFLFRTVYRFTRTIYVYSLGQRHLSAHARYQTVYLRRSAGKSYREATGMTRDPRGDLASRSCALLDACCDYANRCRSEPLRYHVFDENTEPYQLQHFYQLSDLHDPEIRRIVHSEKELRVEPDVGHLPYSSY